MPIQNEPGEKEQSYTTKPQARSTNTPQLGRSQSTHASTTNRSTHDSVKHTSERDSSAQLSEGRSTADNAGHSTHDSVKHSSERDSRTHQSESRSNASTARPARHDSLDVPPKDGGGSRKNSSETLSDVAINTTTTTSIHHNARSGLSNSNSNTEAVSEGDPSGSLGLEHGVPRVQASSVPTASMGRSPMTRVSLASESPSYAQVTSKHPQHLQGATEDTTARRPQDVAPGRRSEDEEDPSRTSEIKQSTVTYTQWIREAMPTSIMGGPPKDRYQILKEDHNRVRDELRQARITIENYDRELRRRHAELRQASHHIGHLQHENQRSKDSINSLQNELVNIHQQLNDAKNLSEVRGKELVGAQVFLTKADTLSISEVGEKVTALNEEIFQAAATLGEALIHKRHEVSQTELDAAAAVSKAMVGEKMTSILIAQSKKPEPEVNPLLVQVVLQIFMVKFCVSKIQSWYPGDPVIGDFLFGIYSEIRSSAEEQAVSGRWRALTRAHTRPSTESWDKELYQKLHSVLMIASWAARTPENEKSYGHRLPSIFKAINELRIAIGEKVTSEDLDIFVIECDKPYNPSIMDDGYSDGRQSSGKRAPEAIIGTTGFGLGKILVEGSAKDVPGVQHLIRAKIVLTSTLNEALEPVQSTRLIRKKKPVENKDGVNRDGREERTDMT